MRGLIFDPFAGISGDMVLGALVNVSGREDWLRETVAAVDLGAQVRVESTRRLGIACHQVSFQVADDQPDRHLDQVLEVIEASGVPERARKLAARVFHRLAEAEAAVHGVAPGAVHFHEVGAVDSILDVLGAAVGVTELGYETSYARAVSLGRGTLAMDHGPYPVPAPATARLLEGLDVRDPGFEGECTTPTGAALLVTLTDRKPAPARMTLGRSGFGAGSRDPADRPNCLRVMECEVAEAGRLMFMVQTDLDDMPAEYAAATQRAVLDAGAVDTVVVAVGMKKGRQGVRLEALTPAGALQAVMGAVFASSSTIGVRYWPVDRVALPRETETVVWRGQEIRCKRVRLPDGSERMKPEYADVEAAARVLGLSAYEARLAFERERTPGAVE